MPRRKRKINWDAVAGAVQILVVLIEIGIVIVQCITNNNNEIEEENNKDEN